MSSPSLELQGLIVARLKGDATVSALVGDRIYDSVPADADFPYVSMGPRDEISDDTDCRAGFELSLQIDVWSRQPGYPEAQRVSDTVRRCLVTYEFPAMENPLVYFKHQQTRIFRDPDGLTTHAALTFEAFAEQP